TKISMYDWLKKTKSMYNENEFLKIYLDFNRPKLIKRISLRTSKMLQIGVIKEVKRFITYKIKKDSSVNKVIGINELKQYLKNQMTLEEVEALISIRTRQYAKRQATWARSRMTSWNKISQDEIFSLIKKINKSTLKLDQLI
ncbi:tRNA (adenosine(37)-N6)-dimethylallyltransferase MiaA, partial [Candidatus Pelagibacter sp.]|nr:tRNA (adenosine(37)-N6)-dimethylallyltransferase MiaA [Candidatus Pelagibacter sp.]